MSVRIEPSPSFIAAPGFDLWRRDSDAGGIERVTKTYNTGESRITINRPGHFGRSVKSHEKRVPSKKR